MTDNTEYKEMLWGRLVYKRVGSVSLTTLFGFAIYQRVGELRSIFGLVYGK